MAANLDAMRGKMAELREQSARAKSEGRHDEAGQLWEKAENLERESQAGQQKIERFKVESQLKYVRMMAERAEKRGERERMEALARASGHLTPDKLRDEMRKMPPDLPIWIFHVKPQLYQETAAELAQIDPTRIHILEQGKTYTF